jgi:hypothetical protein
MINNQYYRESNYFIWDIMEYCSRQCIRRTFYAVIVGISPIVICLLLIAIVRLILHCLEISYYRGQKPTNRRRSSSLFYQANRPTLLYTPVSIAEIQRIIQGEYQSQQQSESSLPMLHDDNSSPKGPKFIKSILTRLDPPSSTDTLANLVIRREAIGSTPLTALFAPISPPVTPTFNIINEQKNRRPSVMTVKHESIETTTLATRNNNNNNIFFITDESSDIEETDTDPSVTSPKTMTTTTTTTTLVVEEFFDFHSVRSVPYALNLVSSVIEK